MKSIRPWWKLVIVMIVLLGYLSVLLLINFFVGKEVSRGFKFRRKFCRAALRILRIKYDHKGHHHTGACLYVSNHRSLLDPLIQLAYIEAYIVSKAEVGSYPLLGRGAKETGIILVHRDNQNSRKAALDAIEEKLRAGFPVLIYPEGTTYGGELTGEFRRGAIEMAAQKGYPVIPVMIDYVDAEYFWTDGSFMNYFKHHFSQVKDHHVYGQVSGVQEKSSPNVMVSEIRATVEFMIKESRDKRSERNL